MEDSGFLLSSCNMAPERQDVVMKCPCCRTELIVKRQMRLETLEEHVCNPNGEPSLKNAYECSNRDCPSVPPALVWDEFGSLYVTGKDFYTSKGIPFINNNNAPFGSFERRWNVERDDIRNGSFIIPCWPLKGWSVHFYCHRLADENGDVIAKKHYLCWVRPDGYRHIWGIHMFVFCLRGTLKNWKELRRNPASIWSRKELQTSVEQLHWAQAEWWRKINAKLAQFVLQRYGTEA